MKRLTDAEIVEAFFQHYIHQDTGTVWNWFVVKMDDNIKEEFNLRLKEREGGS